MRESKSGSHSCVPAQKYNIQLCQLVKERRGRRSDGLTLTRPDGGGHGRSGAESPFRHVKVHQVTRARGVAGSARPQIWSKTDDLSFRAFPSPGNLSFPLFPLSHIHLPFCACAVPMVPMVHSPLPALNFRILKLRLSFEFDAKLRENYFVIFLERYYVDEDTSSQWRPVVSNSRRYRKMMSE